MSRYRVSIAAMVLVVAVVALGFAALRAASELWASVVFTTAVGASSLAILGALLRRGSSRAPWAGFALFGWIYLFLIFGSLGFRDPPDTIDDYDHLVESDTGSLRPHLVTSRLLNDLSRFNASTKPLAVGDEILVKRKLAGGYYYTPAFVFAINHADGHDGFQVEYKGRGQREWVGMDQILTFNLNAFLRTGHSLFAIVSGLIGAFLASLIVATNREPDERPADRARPLPNP